MSEKPPHHGRGERDQEGAKASAHEEPMEDVELPERLHPTERQHPSTEHEPSDQNEALQPTAI
jgi:hypothetical protein